MARAVLPLAIILLPFIALAPRGRVAGQAGSDAQLGTVLEVKLGEPPHAPGDAPDVGVHVPPGFDPERAVDLVVFLHGFDCCTRSLLAAVATPCRSGEPPHRAWNLA